MTIRRASLIGALALGVGCSRTAPPTTAPATVTPPPTEEEPRVDEAISSACRGAPLLPVRGKIHGRTTAAAPIFAIRLVVPPGTAAESDNRVYTTGEGEVGLEGLEEQHSVALVDMRTVRRMSVNLMVTGVCWTNSVTLPREAGEYCFVLTPLDAGAFSAFDVDYAARAHGHGHIQVPEGESTGMETVCPRASKRR